MISAPDVALIQVTDNEIVSLFDIVAIHEMTIRPAPGQSFEEFKVTRIRLNGGVFVDIKRKRPAEVFEIIRDRWMGGHDE